MEDVGMRVRIEKGALRKSVNILPNFMDGREHTISPSLNRSAEGTGI
jgi:hypothetical protein